MCVLRININGLLLLYPIAYSIHHYFSPLFLPPISHPYFYPLFLTLQFSIRFLVPDVPLDVIYQGERQEMFKAKLIDRTADDDDYGAYGVDNAGL